MWQVVIHCVFLVSALALAGIERMTASHGNGGDHGKAG